MIPRMHTAHTVAAVVAAIEDAWRVSWLYEIDHEDAFRRRAAEIIEEDRRCAVAAAAAATSSAEPAAPAPSVARAGHASH